MRRWQQYHQPPVALRKAQLDNILLIPASALPEKARYQAIANDLPRGAVLLVLPHAYPKERRFLEQTLIPLNEAVHERVVRGEMQNFQELRFADLAQRLLRDVTRLVRPTRDARQILLATPPNDPNQLGLAILELLLFTEGVNCLTLGAGVPAQEIGGASRAYRVALAILLFGRGISGKIAGQEIRSLRTELPEDLPLIVSGRAVNLLAKPIASVRTAADFSSVMAAMRELGVVAGNGTGAVQRA